MKKYLLKNLGSITTGRTPAKSKEENYENGGIPFVKPPNLNGNKPVRNAKEYLSETGLKNANPIEKNSIMVSCIGIIGKVGIAGKRLATNQQINSITFNENLVFYKYGFYLLKSLKQKLNNSANTSVVPILNKSNFSNIEVNIPSLHEQNVIANYLDHLNMIVEKRKENISLLDDFLNSIFLEMFGDPVINNKGYTKDILSNLAEKIGSGSTPRGGSTVYQPQGILFIRSQNVLMNQMKLDNAVFISDDIHNSMKNTWVKNGDVLLNITGASIGRVSYYNGIDNSANVNQHVCIIRPNKNTLNPIFLSFLISQKNYQNKILSENTGGTRQAFNFQKIKKFPIILPSIKNQNKFANIFKQTELLKSKYQESEKELDNLFGSLMQRAFSGEL